MNAFITTKGGDRTLPKLIENLRENILARAREQLLTGGYDALNIRAVAAQCGIAVGTVYNYFASKELLTAHIMMEDWRAGLARTRQLCEQARSVSEALCALYEGVSAFSGTYRSVWASYTFSSAEKSKYDTRRVLLVRQLAGCIEPVLTRFGAEDAAELGVFFAENVLVCTGNSELSFSAFLRIADKILKQS